MFLVLLLQPRQYKSDSFCSRGQVRSVEGSFSEKRFVKGIFLIRERPAQNHDRALSK